MAGGQFERGNRRGRGWRPRSRRAGRGPFLAAPGKQAQRQGEGEDSGPVRQGAAGRAALLPSGCLAAERTCREPPPDALPTLVETAWNAGFSRHARCSAPGELAHRACRNPTYAHDPTVWERWSGSALYSGKSEQGRAMTSAEAGRLAGRPRASEEPLTRGQRLVLTMMTAVLVMKALVLVGGILACNALSGQLRDLRAELREGIGDPRAEVADPRDPASP